MKQLSSWTILAAALFSACPTPVTKCTSFTDCAANQVCYSLGTRGIDHGRKVIQQPAIGRQAAARPCRAPMAVLVVAAHRIAPGIEAPGQRLIAADVLAQAVHQQHGGARLAPVHGPVAQ